ncbi:D-alanyl-D-alanine carboxypeptidase family protein [uncultured Cellulomonas sp.]|uniref:D-alanyl-D-alanine carboxypeptidase family protein n=1 Tax=uncultured Cellulomonas sp. TaxID=189682 RepID=UPI002637AD56|nr:D-alanyl-D-alanine carboxypeptidase family protein [uncultured Cellulomonas sp.]
MDHRHPPATGSAAPLVRRRAAGSWRGAVRPGPARLGAVALAAVLATGVLAQSHEAGLRANAQLQAVEAADAARAELARRDRATSAGTARLDVGFARYAVVRRAQALDAARAAVQNAEAVVVSTAADVPAETVTPLDAAAAELVALIAATPDALTPLAGSAPAVAAPADHPAPGGGVGADVAGADLAAVDHAGADPASPAGTATPTPVAPRVGSAPTAAAIPGDAPAGAPAPVPAPVPADAPADVPADVPAGSAGATSPDAADGVDPAAGPAHPDVLPDPQVLPDPAAIDLSVTAEVLAAAQRVTDLSVQVQAAADAAVAAAEAARLAAEEAARATEAETARRVAVAQAAPNGEIPLDVLCPVAIAPDALLRCDAAAAFDRLADAYRADVGRDLRVVSSYRSLETQVAVKATRGGLAASPGRSNHGLGLAVDLADFGGVGDFTAPAYRWMQENAAQLGWHHPAAMEPGGAGPQEPWHWEYGTEG